MYLLITNQPLRYVATTDFGFRWTTQRDEASEFSGDEVDAIAKEFGGMPVEVIDMSEMAEISVEVY